MRLKKLVIAIFIGLLLVALGFSVFDLYQTADASKWADFVKIFGTFAIGLVVLVMLIVATIIYDYWRDKR